MGEGEGRPFRPTPPFICIFLGVYFVLFCVIFGGAEGDNEGQGLAHRPDGMCAWEPTLEHGDAPGSSLAVRLQLHTQANVSAYYMAVFT